MLNLLFLIPPVLTLAGAALLCFSERRRVNSPRCRDCGYDLGGTLLHSKHCPECGCDLDQRGFIGLDERRRRPWLDVLGLLLILVSAPLWLIALFLFFARYVA